MAKTLITDVVVPEIYLPYHFEETASQSKFIRAGIIARDAEMDALASGGGKIITMPFWQDLSGDSEVMDEANPLTTAKIAATSDAARIQNRAKAWSTSDLAGHLAGDDPMRAIARRTGAWQARDDQSIVLSILKGVFADASMADSILDIGITTGTPTSANTLTGASFIDAQQLLGDQKDTLVAIGMHSQTEAYLKKLDLLETVEESQGNATYQTFRGLRVVTDDNMPVDTSGDVDKYTTYLFGAGAIAWGNDSSPRPLDGAGFGNHYLEYGRTPLSHSSDLILRRWFLMHPRGVKWTDTSITGATGPNNTDLENASNWARVYERKNVRIVKVAHNVLA